MTFLPLRRGLLCGMLVHLLLVAAAAVAAVDVRVLIRESAPQLTLSSDGPFRILALDPSAFSARYHPRDKVLVQAEGSEMRVGDWEVPAGSLRVEADPPYLLQVNSRSYRGRLEIRRERGKGLLVVNVLDLEEYLRGVMKEEISPQWPAEALKAQAVVARTYAYRQILDNREALFHVRSTTDSQLYGGSQGEDGRTDQAVRATQGIILTYDGRSIPAFYHAACGGHTEDAVDVWSYNHSALQGVPCGYCGSHPVYVWQTRLKEEDIRGSLTRCGYPVGKIEAIVPLTRTKTQRILRLEILHDGGRVVMEGKRFRQCLGYDLIRSTNFLVRQEEDTFAFQGKGWGHGVGLCQWGAKGMADLAASYEEILHHYYPGTHLSRMEEAGS